MGKYPHLSGQINIKNSKHIGADKRNRSFFWRMVLIFPLTVFVDVIYSDSAEDESLVLHYPESKAFYVVNPSLDLISTQNEFEKWFKRLLRIFMFLVLIVQSETNWSGLIGIVPSQEEYLTGLSDADLFMY